MTKTIHGGQQVVQSAGSVVSDMNGEKVMFCVNSGKYFNLGAIGGRVLGVDRLADSGKQPGRRTGIRIRRRSIGLRGTGRPRS